MAERQTVLDDFVENLRNLGGLKEWWKSKTPAEQKAIGFRAGWIALVSGIGIVVGGLHFAHAAAGPVSSGHEGALPPTPDASGADHGAGVTTAHYNGPAGTVAVTCETPGHPVVLHGANHQVTIECVTDSGAQVNVLNVDGINTIGAGAALNPVHPIPAEAPVVVDVGYTSTTGIMATGGEINSVVITGPTPAS